MTGSFMVNGDSHLSSSMVSQVGHIYNQANEAVRVLFIRYEGWDCHDINDK